MNSILGVILSPLYNLIYYVFIYGPLFLLNELWQIFTWFSGQSIGKLFFDNNSNIADASIDFNINWQNPVVQIFLTFFIIAVIIFIISMVITLLMHLFKNKVQSTTLESGSTPLRTLKWIFLFPVTVFLIPFGMIVLSFFITLLSTLVSSGFSSINSSLGYSSLDYNLTVDNLNYFHNLASNYLNTLKNYDPNTTYLQWINNMVNYLSSIDKSKLSSDDANLVSQTINNLNTLKGSLQNGFPNIDNLINILSNLTASKSDTIQNNLNNALQPYITTTGINYTIGLINSNLTELINKNVIDPNQMTEYTEFNDLLGPNSKFVAMFQTNLSKTVFNNENAIGLNSLPTYIQENTQSTIFFGTIFIYQFVVNTSDTNWDVASYYNFQASDIVRIFIGFIVVIAALILIILYVFYLTKRIIELACYFVLSPVIAAMAVHDEGAKLTAWLKLVVVKMFSILVLNVTFQIFYILYPIVKTIAYSGFAGQSIAGVSTADIFNFFFIVGGMISSYFATTKLSQFMGDDSNIAQTFAELAVLRTAFKTGSKALGLAKGTLGTGLGLASKGLSTGAKRFFGGKKFYDKDGNVTRFGGFFDKMRMRNERKSFFDQNKNNDEFNIGNWKVSWNKNMSFKDFMKDKDLKNIQKDRWIDEKKLSSYGFFSHHKSRFEKHMKDDKDKKGK